MELLVQHRLQDTQQYLRVFSLFTLMVLGEETLDLVSPVIWGRVKYITEFYLPTKQVKLLEHKKQDSVYNEFNNRRK
jgi:hypothetical protein